MTGTRNGWLRWSGVFAALAWLGAVIGFGALLPGYSQWLHPVALLGAAGVPRALAFNLLGFVLPGMAAGVVAIELRLRLPQPTPWPLRIGGQLLFLAALGFIAMGVFALDARQIDGGSSRYHATAWVLWWLSFAAGAWLLAWGLRGRSGWRRLAWAGAILAAVVLAMAVVLPGLLPPALAQRLAFVAWLGWLVLAGIRTPRPASPAR